MEMMQRVLVALHSVIWMPLEHNELKGSLKVGLLSW